MRCLACDVALNEVAVSRKMPTCGEHWDLCGVCFRVVKESYVLPNTADKATSTVFADSAAVFFLQRGFDRNGNARAAPKGVPD